MHGQKKTVQICQKCIKSHNCFKPNIMCGTIEIKSTCADGFLAIFFTVWSKQCWIGYLIDLWVSMLHMGDRCVVANSPEIKKIIKWEGEECWAPWHAFSICCSNNSNLCLRHCKIKFGKWHLFSKWRQSTRRPVRVLSGADRPTLLIQSGTGRWLSTAC